MSSLMKSAMLFALMTMLVIPIHADPVTVSLDAAGDVTTWPTTTYRWKDMADNLYSQDYQDDFQYHKEPLATIHLAAKDNSWNPIPGGAAGTLVYCPTDELFNYTFDGTNLNQTEYCLIYYPDPWPGNGLIILGIGTPGSNGSLHLEGSLDTGDMPAAFDQNYGTGAKIWLVPSNYVNQTLAKLTGWNQSQFIFEIEWLNYTKVYCPEVILTYQTVGTTFEGVLTATGLKPNFAYQVKLVGKPENDPVWGSNGDDWSNQSLGYAGRWFEQAPGTGNRDDNYVTPLLNNPAYIFEGYIVFDFFATDEYGNATIDLSLDNSLHVLFRTAPPGTGTASPGVNDTNPKYYDVDTFLEPAYSAPGNTVMNLGLWGQHEPGRAPVGEASLPAGDYDVRFLLTEESFHQSDLGGYWAGAMVHNDIEFTIRDESLMLYKKSPTTWQPIQTEEIRGEMFYNSSGPEFSYSFAGIGLNPLENYSLIYYPDPWSGWDLLVLGNGTPDAEGNLQLESSIITGDLPYEGKGYYSWGYGAKIWLVLSSDISSSSPKRMVGWHQSEYLFENNLITYQQTSSSGGDEKAIPIMAVPTVLQLSPPAPNPFNPITTFRYTLQDAVEVTLSVYSVSGRLVSTLVHGYQNVGTYRVIFDASNLASGVYLYQLDAGQHQIAGKMVFIK